MAVCDLHFLSHNLNGQQGHCSKATGVAKRVLPRFGNFLMLLLITSASTCLEHSRNLGSTLFATLVVREVAWVQYCTEIG